MVAKPKLLENILKDLIEKLWTFSFTFFKSEFNMEVINEISLISEKIQNKSLASGILASSFNDMNISFTILLMELEAIPIYSKKKKR